MAAMRGSTAWRVLFNVEIIGGMPSYMYESRSATAHQEERQLMLNKQTVVTELRRDASFVGNAVVVVLFAAFLGLAIAAAIFDIVH